MINKKLFMFVMVLLVLITGIAAIGAADADNSTQLDDNSISDDSSEIAGAASSDASTDDVKKVDNTVKTQDSIATYKSNTNNKEDADKENAKQSDSTKQTTSTKSIKTASTHVVTNQTFSNYFTDSNLNSNVSEGDTLDFQGNFFSSSANNYTMNINKPVNIISSTHDTNISLNTTSLDFFGKKAVDAFTITEDANGTNVTGIYFYNTQIFVRHAANVTLDNITVINENQVVGGGVGVLSVRENSTYVTVKNSYFRTERNGGHSTLVGAWATHCTFDNNTIVGVGRVGNLIYLTTYNTDIPDVNTVGNDYNTITNNKIYRLESSTSDNPICYGIAICGHDNLVENNTVEYENGMGITTQWGSGTDDWDENGENATGVPTYNNIINNNRLLNGSNMNVPVNSTIENNYVTGTTTLNSRVILNNNTFNSLALTGNINITNTKVANITIQNPNDVATVIENSTIENIFIVLGSLSSDDNTPSGSTVIRNNNISNGISVSGSSGLVNNIIIDSNNIAGAIELGKNRSQRATNIEITNNTIKSSLGYTVRLNSPYSENLTVSDNVLVASGSYGDDSVQTTANNVVYSANIPGDETSNTTITLDNPESAPRTVTLNGTYTDKNSNPIANADLKVFINGVESSVTTGNDGKFTINYNGQKSEDVTVVVTDYTDGNLKSTYKEVTFEIDSEALTFVITEDTFDDFFTNGVLNSFVSAGDTLDFQGSLIAANGKNYTMVINKPVNIISSTQDSNISLNSTSRDFFGKQTGDAFTITEDANGTNVTGIYFYNTQIFVKHASDVVFDNITVINENQVVGGGVGVLSVRDNSNRVTVKNSYFRTENNGGHSALVGAWVSNCIFDNNTIYGVGRVGNLIYLTTYNVDGLTDYSKTNENNTISNNKLYRLEPSSSDNPICYGIAICGHDNLVENNTVEYEDGMGITTQWGSGTTDWNENGENATGIPTSGNIYRNNILLNGSSLKVPTNSTVVNNYVSGSATLASDVIANNNTFNALSLSEDIILENSTIGTLTIEATDDAKTYVINNNTIGKILFEAAGADQTSGNALIANNTIKDGITISGISGKVSNVTITSNNIANEIELGPTAALRASEIVISENNITSPLNYTIKISKNSENINITNNNLTSTSTVGDSSVSNEGSNVVIENNGPSAPISLNLITSSVTGKNNKTVTFIVQVSSNGMLVNSGKVAFKLNGVTIVDVNGQKTIKVANGIATFTYLIPYNFSCKDYDLSVVYGNTGYQRGEANGTLTVQRTNSHIEGNIVGINSNGVATLSVNVYDENNNIISFRDTYVSVKVNGITVQKRVAIKNGVGTLNLTLAPSSNPYNITIVTGDNSQYYGTTSTVIYQNPLPKTATHMTATATKTSSSSSVISAKLYDSNNKAVTATTKVSVKIDGKTVSSNNVMKNGNINITVPTPTTSGNHNVTVIAGETSSYASCRVNTTLKV